jgi:hypothetical protein
MAGTPPPDEKDQHPNRGTLGQPPMGGGDHLYLSASQLHEKGGGASWKAPKEPRGKGKWPPRRIAVMVVLLAVLALVIYLKVTGVV